MTRQTRSATTPLVDGQPGMTSRSTSQAIHGSSLADLCNDAAGGHPAQRVTIPWVTAGTFNAYYQPTLIARFLVLRACIIRVGAYSEFDAVTFDLSITDSGGGSVASSDARIPAGLKADTQYVPNDTEGPRFGTASYQSWALDLNDLMTTLSDSDLWRFHLVVTSDPTVRVELFQIEEVTRFAVDTADDFGQLIQDFSPRFLIVDGDHGMERLRTTMRAGMYQGIRTYHAGVWAEAAPITRASSSWGAFTGDTESGSTAAKRIVRARTMRGALANGARVAFTVRYRIVGASGGDVGQIRLHSGSTSSPYTLTLPNITGSWANAPIGSGFLATNLTGARDVLWFEGRVDAGTLSVCARAVLDSPV